MTAIAQQNRGEQLATQLNLGEVLSWRLHWLMLQLCDVQKKAEALAIHTSPLHGASQDLMALVNALTAVMGEFSQLHWQTKTMLGLDYDDEVMPLFEHVPKYADFRAQLKTTQSVLEAKAAEAMQADLNFMLLRIESAAKAR
ncbi:hypothetical protein KTD31_00655 [Burkholderia multivorans]|uniref:hypothetical protein n=1 Tax=Burkholderia multivorans TaxID=87883 RepID=UPI001C226C64|nr:hypothetical protein [Burkholderia multivorans]MBU9199910.1 hypothetical protein [Burkholderia multivorans]MDN8078971.1 hypothetical protein [Burkholderia multivorans]